MAKNIQEAISKAKVIVTWASFYGDNYNYYDVYTHRKNLEGIEEYASDIIKLLEEVE